MNLRKPRRDAVVVIAVISFAIIGASCSKGTATTTTTATSTTLVPVGPVDGWSAKQLPNPPGATNAFLAGVACPSSSSCLAVGAYGKSNSEFFSLVEHWNGSAWSIEPEAGARSPIASRLLGISCPSAATCFAVGEVLKKSTTEGALIEHFNGSAWTYVRVPLPKNISSSSLTAISCSSPSACTAIGSYIAPPLGQSDPMLLRWNGINWALEAAPARLSHVTSITFLQVSCASVTACTAVGQSTTTKGASAYAAHWNGQIWLDEPLPVLPGRTFSRLSGISCVSVADCTAVGDSADAAGHDVSLAERWDGRSWTVESTPGLPDLQLLLSAVYCPTPGACTAVGRQTIAVYGSSGWHVQPAPVTTSVPVSDLSGPSALACLPSGECTAVGVTISQAGLATMLVVTKP
jgi:hypothetical protein